MILLIVAVGAFGIGYFAGRWNAVGPQPAASGSPATTPPWSAVPAAATDANGPFEVWLAEPGTNAIHTIKAIRTATRLGLKDAKDLHDSAPAPLTRVNTAAEVEALQRTFNGVARLEVRSLAAAPAPSESVATGSMFDPGSVFGRK